MQVKARTTPKEDGSAQPDAPVETPTQKIVREGRPIRTVVDAKGRKITYRRLSVLDEARLARQLGADLAGNAEYMRYVRIACAVQNIDGDVGVVAVKPSFAEVRIDWVGDEGFIAIWNDMIEQNKAEDGDDEIDLEEKKD